jgi:hypothetical protein
MCLVKSLSNENNSKADRQTILVFTSMGQTLRASVSHFNRFDIKEAELDQLRIPACDYLRINGRFLPDEMNPTIWTLGRTVNLRL